MKNPWKHACVVATVAMMGVAGCAANPGPAPVEVPSPGKETPNSTSQQPKPEPKPNTAQLSVGIDPIDNGLNPHLRADDSLFVRTLASLVLPSAFNAEGTKLNTDLLVSADVQEKPALRPDGSPYAMTVKYVVRGDAQWSDGTPITVSDFTYLANQIVATPTALDANYYRAIGDIRSSNGGKTIEVDFDRPVARWQILFSNLLPSHLVRDQSFDQVLANNIAASAGRYSVGGIDRAQGLIALQRNDRYWGSTPGQFEKIDFHVIRSTTQAVNMVESEQVDYLDLAPWQTTVEALSFVPGVAVATSETNRELALSANAALPIETRRALLGAINIPAVARLSTERNVDLDIPLAQQEGTGTQFPPVAPQDAKRMLSIGVDAHDPYAARAARAIENMLLKAGLKARVVESESVEIEGTLAPKGDVDLVVGWRTTAMLPRYQCTKTAEEIKRELADKAATAGPSSAPAATASPSAGAAATSTTPAPPSASAEPTPQPPARDDSDVLVGANMSGYCTLEAQEFIDSAISSGLSAQEIAQWGENLNERESLSVPLFRDSRVQAVGKTINKPVTGVAQWPGDITSIELWRKNA